MGKVFPRPKPGRRPPPPIMNAGSSDIGTRFAAKHADMAFIGFYEDGLEDGKAKLTEMRRIGREDFAREFQIWTSCRVVCRPTEREAQDYAHYYIHEKGDFGAVETIIREQGHRDPNMTPEFYERMKRRL